MAPTPSLSQLTGLPGGVGGQNRALIERAMAAEKMIRSIEELIPDAGEQLENAVNQLRAAVSSEIQKVSSDEFQGGGGGGLVSSPAGMVR